MNVAVNLTNYFATVSSSFSASQLQAWQNIASGVHCDGVTLGAVKMMTDLQIADADAEIPHGLAVSSFNNLTIIHEAGKEVDGEDVVPLDSSGIEDEVVNAWDSFTLDVQGKEQEAVKALRRVLMYADDDRIANAMIAPATAKDILPLLEEMCADAERGGKDRFVQFGILRDAIRAVKKYSSVHHDDPSEFAIIKTRKLTDALELRRARRFYADPRGSDRETTAAICHHTSRIMAEYYGGAAKRPVYSGMSGAKLRKVFSPSAPPAEPTPLPSVFDRFMRDVAMHNMNLPHPAYIGHMLTYAPMLSVMSDALASMLNPNQIAWEVAPASTYAELQTLDWMCSIVGFPRNMAIGKGRKARIVTPGGTFAAGGTLANLTALLVARNKAMNDFFKGLGRSAMRIPGYDMRFARLSVDYGDLDVTKLGLWGAMQVFLSIEKDNLPRLKKILETQFVILASAESHYSIKKLAGYIGIGSDNVIMLPVDKCMHIDLKAMKDKIEELELRDLGGRRTVIIAIVAAAGTTETGNVDSLSEIADYCRGKGIWFHVDAAFGGGALLSERHRRLLAGIEKADSVTIDPQKWFFELPYALGAVLFKDREMLRHYLKSSAPYVIHEDALPEEPNLGAWSVQGSMKAAFLKLWLTWHAMGTRTMGRIIDHNVEMAKYMEQLVRGHPELEAMHPAELCLLCFRYLPLPLKRILNKAIAQRDFQLISAVNRGANEINAIIQRQIHEGGKSWLSRTEMHNQAYNRYRPGSEELNALELDSQSVKRLKKGFVVDALRACIMNPYTDRVDIENVIAEVITRGNAAYNIWRASTRLFSHLPGYAR